jgi:hypothetical protein
VLVIHDENRVDAFIVGSHDNLPKRKFLFLYQQRLHLTRQRPPADAAVSHHPWIPALLRGAHMISDRAACLERIDPGLSRMQSKPVAVLIEYAGVTISLGSFVVLGQCLGARPVGALAVRRGLVETTSFPKDPMKKFAFACLLALPLTAASQQKASAWCEFHIGGSFNLGFTCSGCGWCGSCASPFTCHDGWGGGNPYCPGPYDASAWGAYGDQVAPATPAAPTTTSRPATSMLPTEYPSANWGYQAIGYNQFPSYWYGR